MARERPYLGDQEAGGKDIAVTVEAEDLTDRVQDLSLAGGQVVAEVRVVATTVELNGNGDAQDLTFQPNRIRLCLGQSPTQHEHLKG